MSEDKIELFLNEGRELLETLRHSHELANEKQKAADSRINFAQWVFVILLVPILFVSGTNMADISDKLDEREAYEKFATKTKTVFLLNDVMEINETFFSIRESTKIETIENKYEKALREFMGDVSRSAKKEAD
jgi:hypothetical protein